MDTDLTASYVLEEKGGPIPVKPLPKKGRRRGRSKLSKLEKKEALYFWLFVSPWVVGFVVFLAGPMIASVFISLTDWDSFTPPTWVGFDNFKKALTDDPIFWKSLWNTAYYAVISVPLSMGLALGLATLLSKKIKGKKLFRTLIYLPTLVPIVATALVFKMVLAPSGLVNKVLGLVGIHGPAWLLDPTWAKPALILMSLWGTGMSTVLLLSAMNSIPVEFFEAADIDGASKMRQFWQITVPQVSPIIFFNLIMQLVGAFQIFSQVYILTSGGPDNASMMMVPLLFREAFEFYHFGYSSAIAWLLFVVIVGLTIVAFRTSKGWVFYESEVQ